MGSNTVPTVFQREADCILVTKNYVYLSLPVFWNEKRNFHHIRVIIMFFFYF